MTASAELAGPRVILLLTADTGGGVCAGSEPCMADGSIPVPAAGAADMI